jgi:hypothetical protein
LPNWIGISAVEKRIGRSNQKPLVIFDILEQIVEMLQRRYMGKLSGSEVVGHQMLYFHPQDQGPVILEKYNKRVKLLML